MRVEDFEVNAHISDSRGIVRAASRDDAGRVVYNINLEDSINVAALNYRRLKANHDSQGMPIVFRARANPNSTIRRGYSYSITVDVLYRGSQHRETGSITLTASQDG